MLQENKMNHSMNTRANLWTGTDSGITLHDLYAYTHTTHTHMRATRKIKKGFSRTLLSAPRSHHCLPTSSISSGRRACATVCWIFRWESRPVMASRPGEKSHAGEHWSSVTSGGDHDGSHGGPQPPWALRLWVKAKDIFYLYKEIVIPKLQLGVVEKRFLATVVDRILEET